MMLVQASAAEKLAQHALLAEINAALEAHLFRFCALVDNARREPVQQRRSPLKFLGIKLSENLVELALPRGVVGGKQAPARLGKREVDHTAVGFSLTAPQEHHSYQAIYCLACCCVADPEECGHIADCLSLSHAHKLEQLQLGHGDLVFRHFPEQLLFNHIRYR
jgi:hypothetical protein